MATTNQIKFYKVQTLPTTLVTGAVYFEVTTQTIYVAKSTTETDKFGVGLKNASLVEGILTIERHDGTKVTIDFNDIASASSVQTALNAINDKINDEDAVSATGIISPPVSCLYIQLLMIKLMLSMARVRDLLRRL